MKFFFFFAKKPWIRIQNPESRIRNPDPHEDETLDPDPDPHYGLCGSETLILATYIYQYQLTKYYIRIQIQMDIQNSKFTGETS